MDIDAGMSDFRTLDGEEERSTGNSSDRDLIFQELCEPYVGMDFDSEDAAKAYFEAYAQRVGFTIRAGQFSRSKLDGMIVTREFLCAREGLKRKSADSCNVMIKVEKRDSDKWVVTKFIKDHNHSTVSTSKVQYLRPRRHFAGTAKPTSEHFEGFGVSTEGSMFMSGEPNRSARNVAPIEASRTARSPASVSYGRSSRKKTLGKDAQNLLDYFKRMQAENPGFFYAIQLDDENHMTNVFWADARSRTAYTHFGDAVTFDTMYRPNQYRVPFAPFTGVNHHGQTVLFGCALIFDESESSFLWLFRTWLEAMSNCAPQSITTDQDRAIQAAVNHVFPQTRHCICKWHILREGQERLGHVCHLHPTFQEELYNCINLTETIQEFESCWSSLVGKYELRNNEWLQALYNARRHWAPVYFRDTFFAAISVNQGYESVGSFFDGYVNQQTTLPLFFRQYERALENWFEKEIEADFETMCTTPVLKTPSPMERQAANLYTRKIFAKFQDELVETFVYTANRINGDGAISTFRVAKFEDDDKAYIVTLNVPEMKASCSCQMFEFSGILCRHVLTVFTVTNVLTLPSHYILKRWTRNAKSTTGIDERQSEPHVQESMTLRYNNLCREAIKYADEGAIAIETYNVAMNSLREGTKKIAVVKKNVARVAPPSSHSSGSHHDDAHRKNPISASDMTPLLWPRQDEVTRRFNLNDYAGIPSPPVADLNLPRMAPVSVHRDEVPAENMDTESTSGESEVKFQVSRDTLGAMLRSMAYIREQLSNTVSFSSPYYRQ
ncbi:hypothetical protein ACHQM5_018468 [Ranunculus cassubicifolius]